MSATAPSPHTAAPAAPGDGGVMAGVAAERHRLAGLRAYKAQDWETAVAHFRRAATEAPAEELPWLNLGRAQLAAGQWEEAEASARQAVEVAPDSPLARRLLGEILGQRHRFAEAARLLDALPAHAPRDADWHNAHGNLLFQARRLQEALGAYMAALQLRLDDALVHYRLGLTFKDLGLTREATECFRSAVQLDREGPTRALALSLLVHEGRQTCDWTHTEADTAALLAAVDSADETDAQLLSPFALLAIDATPEQQRRCGALRVRGLTRHLTPLPPAGPRQPGRLRLGYLSCDFSQHATSVLLAELLELRDRSRFEVFLYSHGADDGSAIGARVRAAADHWHDVSQSSHGDIARLMRAHDLDIAVDLKGHTRGSRFELLAWRPARVQAAWLGYPATTGADFIDYLIGDPVVTPLEHADDFSERIAQLPYAYQPNDRHRALPPAPPRAALGLPQDAVVLCSFNQAYKISPRLLDLWAEILARAPNTVLWMLAWNPHAQVNLMRELGARGVAASRVAWAPKLPLDAHIARLRQADLFLDTWPCNAHTTASEALWAGVPVLTVPGRTFASRVAASLVHACALGALVCEDEAAYVARAVSLARNPDTLAGIKAFLERRRLRLPLFNTPRLAGALDALYERMAARHAAGLPPDHLPAQCLPDEAGPALGG
ncbi:O-linked N-acetylglucosamine transferase, SPINDLY family protein [Ideonella livida]|uniref:protein O-GlcNAc transferase n=1 Tax=Ideonella livida TaxID=2707176 RepID=A0A7C9PF62_9BURK|nr:tetratricopeptide repeat protein [Ideonella livida]NDY89910.1 tetratricopeptide repeat protein [Ideonella livida]